MSDKGIGVTVCKQHGEYMMDAPDSPCPSCDEPDGTRIKIKVTLIEEIIRERSITIEVDEEELNEQGIEGVSRDKMYEAVAMNDWDWEEVKDSTWKGVDTETKRAIVLT